MEFEDFWSFLFFFRRRLLISDVGYCVGDLFPGSFLFYSFLFISRFVFFLLVSFLLVSSCLMFSILLGALTVFFSVSCLFCVFSVYPFASSVWSLLVRPLFGSTAICLAEVGEFLRYLFFPLNLDVLWCLFRLLYLFIIPIFQIWWTRIFGNQIISPH